MTNHTAPPALGWRKSSYSQGANACVEVTDRIPGRIAIRECPRFAGRYRCRCLLQRRSRCR